MAALILPSRRVVQPQGAVEIDWSNPLARDLRWAGAPSSANVTRTGTVSNIAAANGTAWSFTNVSSSRIGSKYTPPTTGPCTLLTLLDVRAHVSNAAYIALGDRTTIGANGVSGFQFFTFNGSTYSSTSIGTAASDGPAVIIGRHTGSQNLLNYRVLSGESAGFYTSSSASALPRSHAAQELTFGGQGENPTRVSDCLIYLGAFWARSLAESEVAALVENPWQLFRPIQRRIWVPVAGGGGISQTVAFTLEDVSAAVSQNLSHAQSLTGTLDDVTVSISQTAQHSQALSATLDDIAFSASQTVGNATNQTLAITLDGVTVAAAQTLSHSQSVNATLDGVAFAASQTLSHSQALAATLDGITVAINQSAAPSSKDQSLAVVLDGIQVAIAQEGPANLIDTHDGFWAKEWARIRAREKRKYQAEVQERVEEIQDEIAEVEQQIVEVKQAPKPKKATPARDFYAEQARIVEHLIARRNQLIDEEDEELLLLL